MTPRRPFPPLRLALLTLTACAGAAAQERRPGDDMDDARPPAAAYVVVDGARIEAPLGGARGDAARGRAIFADPDIGGCTACHAAPGLPLAAGRAPRVLRDRLAPLPPPEPPSEDPAAAAEPEPPPAEADSRLAPPTAPAPAERPDPDAAAAEDGPEDDDEPDPFEDAEALPPLLPLPPGPALHGVADRLTEAELRLVTVNPRLRDPASIMPAYHDVSPALAARAPGLRQPWLSPAQLEDVVAYLATLTDPPAPE